MNVVKILIGVACLALLAPSTMHSATAKGNDGSDQFDLCCEKRTVSDERGQWQEERWKCVMERFDKLCDCEVMCVECGVNWVCAKHSVVYDACTYRADYSGAPNQHCLGIDANDFYEPHTGETRGYDICNSLSMACYLNECSDSLVEEECDIRCGGN